MDTDASLADAFMSCVEEASSSSGTLLEAALHRGARYADLFLEQTRAVTLQLSLRVFTSSAPHFHIQEHITGGVAIRAFDERIHRLSHVAGWRPESLPLTLLRNAALEVAADFGPMGIKARDADVNPRVTWEADLPADAPANVSRAEKEHFLAALMESAFSYEPAITRCALEYTEATRRSLLINNKNQSVACAQARYGVKMTVMLGDSGVATYMTRGYTGGFGAMAFDDSTDFVRDVVDCAKRLGDARSMPAGVMPVVFAGGQGGLWLHETAGHLLEADVAPEALLAGRKIGPRALTIVDDATLKGQQGSFSSDDEGTPGRQNVLVDEGRVAGLMTDRRFALQRGGASTGNGRRARYIDTPLPRMTNLCLLPGKDTPESLVKTVKQGLYVKRAAAGVHCKKGDTFEIRVLEGYYIDAGQITHPVHNVVVSGNPLLALQQVAGVGHDAEGDQGMGICVKAGQLVPVSINSPTVQIEGLQVWQQ